MFSCCDYFTSTQSYSEVLVSMLRGECECSSQAETRNEMKRKDAETTMWEHEVFP